MCLNAYASHEVDVPQEKALIAYRAFNYHQPKVGELIRDDHGRFTRDRVTTPDPNTFGLRPVYNRDHDAWQGKLGKTNHAPTLNNQAGLYVGVEVDQVLRQYRYEAALLAAVKVWGHLALHEQDGGRAEFAEVLGVAPMAQIHPPTPEDPLFKVAEKAGVPLFNSPQALADYDFGGRKLDDVCQTVNRFRTVQEWLRQQSDRLGRVKLDGGPYSASLKFTADFPADLKTKIDAALVEVRHAESELKAILAELQKPAQPVI